MGNKKLVLLTKYFPNGHVEEMGRPCSMNGRFEDEVLAEHLKGTHHYSDLDMDGKILNQISWKQNWGCGLYLYGSG
jgi:hypothetical protein